MGITARIRARLQMINAGTPAVLIYGGIFAASVLIVVAFSVLAQRFGRWIVSGSRRSRWSSRW